jgi:AcrR family transcriptional regulator
VTAYQKVSVRKPYDNRRRLQVSDRKRNAILAAAKTLAAAHGFHSLTVSDLARESGFSRQTIYTLLGTRERVLTAFFHKLADEDRLNPSLRTERPEFALAAFVAEFTEPYAKQLSLLRRVPQSPAAVPQELKKPASRNRRRRLAATRVVDLLAKTHGPWTAEDRKQKAMNLYSLTSRQFFVALAEGYANPRRVSDVVLTHAKKIFEPAP